MAKTIWKYTLLVEDEQTLEMPEGARLLTVQIQHGRQQLWALVDDAEKLVSRAIATRGTGHPADGLDECDYLGTYQLSDGALVFHVFDRGVR
jgi:hypothetical protein